MPYTRLLPWLEARKALAILLRCLGLGIDSERIAVVVSCSKSTAAARIWGLPRVFQVGFGLKPLYVVEFVYPKASMLAPRERLEILVHEIAHIPRGFTGGLRPHNDVFRREYRRLLRKALGCEERGRVEELLASMPDPCRGGV